MTMRQEQGMNFHVHSPSSWDVDDLPISLIYTPAGWMICKWPSATPLHVKPFASRSDAIRTLIRSLNI